MALESITQELAKVLSKTFNPMEIENLPETSSEQVLECFSRVPYKVLNFLLIESTLLRDFSSIDLIEDKCACPLSIYYPLFDRCDWLTMKFPTFLSCMSSLLAVSAP